MVTEGALAITEQKEQINELNVFPVPDGDTGTNMSMTMTAAMNELAKLSEPTLAKAADTTASALLRGARGNSGVILSLLFRGMAKKLRETYAANGRDLALALREGVDTAYKAVMKPAEGTILTVSRVAAQKTVEQCQADDSLSAEQVLAAIVKHGRAALAETVHQNPVLEKAGVVDAGGFGFITILEGMLDAMRGIHKERTVEQPARAAANFEAIRDEDITFTYCTEFIAERKDKARNVGRLRAILNDIGDSLVVVEDDDIVKVHVHTDQPMLAVDPDAEQDTELATAMTEAASHVRSGQVTYAARDSEFDGKKIKQGEYLSLSEGRLCASGRETSVLKKLVREMVSDDSAFATVIFGEGVTEEQAAEVENLLHKANKDMEISVINGGQPVYYYILSVE